MGRPYFDERALQPFFPPVLPLELARTKRSLAESQHRFRVSVASVWKAEILIAIWPLSYNAELRLDEL